MSTLGEALVESLTKSGITVGPEEEHFPLGIAGTESDNLGALIQRYTKMEPLEREKEPPKKTRWSPFTIGGWPTNILASLISLMQIGKKQPSQPTRAETFSDLVPMLTHNLRQRGQEDEVIQELVNALARLYGQETIDISKGMESTKKPGVSKAYQQRLKYLAK